jgi:hypothetical protein
MGVAGRTFSALREFPWWISPEEMDCRLAPGIWQKTAKAALELANSGLIARLCERYIQEVITAAKTTLERNVPHESPSWFHAD